jgi:chemotaxis protein CheX
MRAEMLNAFVVAAGQVLASEIGVKVTRGALSLQREAYLTDDITVLLNLVGDVWGIAFYSLSFETAKGFVSRMLGQPVASFDELAMSGIGELGNVITGQASTRLADLGLKSDISVPSLIVGKGSRISTLDMDRLVIPLDTELGVFRLDLALRESQGK